MFKHHSPASFSIGFRARLAYFCGKLAISLSRKLGKGDGGVIGGLVSQKIDPQILEKLCRNKKVILVTGTNGKSTTTKMVRKAVSLLGPVASNIRGDNMYTGAISALLDCPRSPYIVLEVDELHLSSVANAVKPCGFVLLNLSRDQLDRMGEITRVENHIRQTVAQFPQAFVVANCDDPLITSAAFNSAKVIWVGAGCAWTADSISFPLTGTKVIRSGIDWQVLDHDEYRRPEPEYYVDAENIYTPDGIFPLALKVPGQANRGNAAQAVATAVQLGVEGQAAVNAVGQVEQVAGRYAKLDINGRQCRLILAKNPAGWQESLSMLSTTAKTFIIAVNGQVPDGKDLSWLWDVNFEFFSQVKNAKILACGDRGADLAVRLRYAGIESELMPHTWEAINTALPGEVDILANYTAFRDLKALLAEKGFWQEAH